jgi:hypothetical protein
MVDWNVCIGKNNRKGHGSTARQEVESTVPRNGRRMLEFCMDNNLLICKTIHQITYTSTTRGIRSTTDYFMYKRPTKYSVMDVRAFRSTELNREQRLLIMETRCKAPKMEKRVTYNKGYSHR